MGRGIDGSQDMGFFASVATAGGFWVAAGADDLHFVASVPKSLAAGFAVFYPSWR